MGRPKIKLTPKHYPLITELCKRGVRETDIARALGVSYVTFTRIKREDERAAEALAEGRAVEHDKLFSKLFEQAMDGNTVALLFLLKCRHGYREQVDLTSQNTVQITFQIPGALKADDYKRLIEHEPDRA